MELNNRRQFQLTADLLATPQQRIINFLIDMVMMGIMLFIVILFIMAYTTVKGDKDFIVRFAANTLWQYMLSAVTTLVYYNFFEIFTSRTVGKFCTNTIVVNENGEKVDYETIMIRSLIRIIPFYWISFMVFPGRGLHDVISKTFVVNKKLLDERKQEFYSQK